MIRLRQKYFKREVTEFGGESEVISSLCAFGAFESFWILTQKSSKMKFCTLFFSAMFAVLFLSCVLLEEGSFMVSAHHHRNENNIMEILAAGLVVKLLQEMNHHHGR
ncbi:hypothetical protein HNY73_020150 [Argiope bruennichi]|uniref:Uncharacterized protein n=1 Tax=Argiope bruennichi TaxID=94029 RepID=A0A8T0E5P3_ARGBR|nr:hypothetical protein HNY73_020150 [Argiope bruennichi]